MEIPQEIREKINQLDLLSKEINDWFENNINYEYVEGIEISEFVYSLNNLEEKITDLQENQNWIMRKKYNYGESI